MATIGAPATSKNDYATEAVREQQAPARNEHGQFVSFPGKTQDLEQYVEGQGSGTRGQAKNDMSNMLRHIEQLESKLSVKEKQLQEATQRVEKFSARTREGMQRTQVTVMGRDT